MIDTGTGGRLGLLAGKTGWRRYIGPKRAVIFVLFAAVMVLAWRLRRDGLLTPETLRHYLDSYPVLSGLLFVGFYAFSVLTALPSLPFNLAAGVFWGPIGGGLIAALGTATGATAAFLAARLLFGQPLARRFDSRFVAWLQAEFDRKGWRFIAFLRLNPVFPTGPLNYVLGLTSIGLVPYVWATAVFILPPSVAVAWIGSAMGTFVADGDVAAVMRLIIAVSAAVTVLAGLRFGARYLNEQKARAEEPAAKPFRADPAMTALDV